MLRFYDDELHNLILVANRNFSEIIDHTSKYDFHPPVQYLLNKISLQLFGLNEFWLSLPSIIFIILAFASRFVFKITGSTTYSLVSSFIIASNPLILLWSSSIRWYPLWTLLAFISIYSVIKLFSEPKKGSNLILKGSLIVTLTLSLYTNYQTIILMVSFIIMALLMDLKNKKNKYYHLKLLAPVIAGVVILFIPYAGSFQNHLETFFIRKEIYTSWSGTSIFFSGGYFLFSVLFGNSIYPWDIRFILLFLTTFTSGLGFIIYYKTHYSDLLKTYSQRFLPEVKRKSLNLLIVLTIILFLLFLIQSIISNSILSRGLLLLPILLVIVTSIIIYHLISSIPIKIKFALSISVLSFYFIWLVGSYNIFVKQSLHKAGLMEPVEQVTALVQNISNTSKENLIVITFDPVLTYYLVNSESSSNTSIISPYINDTNTLLVSVNSKTYNEKVNFDSTALLIFIQTYPGL